MQVWISNQKQKSLLQSLNLDSDSFITKSKSKLRVGSPVDSIGGGTRLNQSGLFGNSTSSLLSTLAELKPKPTAAATTTTTPTFPTSTTESVPPVQSTLSGVRDTITSFIGNVFAGITEAGGTTQNPDSTTSTPSLADSSFLDDDMPKLLDPAYIATIEHVRMVRPYCALCFYCLLSFDSFSFHHTCLTV